MNINSSSELSILTHNLEMMALSLNANSDESRSTAITALQKLAPLVIASSAEERARICATLEAVKLWANQRSGSGTEDMVIELANRLLNHMSRGVDQEGIVFHVSNSQESVSPNPLSMEILKRGVYQAAASGNVWVLDQLSPAAIRELLVTTNSNGETVLHIAVTNKQLAFLKKLQEKLADREEFSRLPLTNEDLATFICLAVDDGDAHLLDGLQTICMGRMLQQDAQGYIPLDYALRERHNKGVFFLLRQFSPQQFATLDRQQNTSVYDRLESELRHTLTRRPIEIPVLFSYIDLIRAIPDVLEGYHLKKLFLTLPTLLLKEFFEKIGNAPSPLMIAADKDLKTLKNMIAELKQSGISPAELNRMLKLPGVAGNTLLHMLEEGIITFLLEVDPSAVEDLLQTKNNDGHTPLAKAITLDLREDAIFLLQTAKQHELAGALKSDPSLKTAQAIENILLSIIRSAQSPLELLTKLKELPAGILIGNFGVIPHFITTLLTSAEKPSGPVNQNMQRAMRLINRVTLDDPLFQKTIEYFHLLPKEMTIDDHCQLSEWLAEEINHDPSRARPYNEYIQLHLKDVTKENVDSPAKRHRLVEQLRREFDALMIANLLRDTTDLLSEEQINQFKGILPTEPQQWLWCSSQDFMYLQDGLLNLKTRFSSAKNADERASYRLLSQHLSFASAAAFENTCKDFNALYPFRTPIEGPISDHQVPASFTPAFTFLQELHTGTSPRWKPFLETRAGLSSTMRRSTGNEALALQQWMQTEGRIAEWATARVPVTSNLMSEIHRLLCQNLEINGGIPGEYRGIEVVGGNKSYLEAKYVNRETRDFTEWLARSLDNCDRNPTSLPLIVGTAAKAHQWLLSIHPFTDGNGRTSRLVMDYILQRYGILPPLLKDFSVAVFPEISRDKNVSADHAFKVVWEGIQESYRYWNITI